ncbi:hypothetical protein B0H16DRAFT_1716047 [Mycena metata]|uniref:WD40 repeat-like protein n=1 Tax=Mycena metata TaxID=1033252 RepID=A0AAD7JNW0_9AGAR|nr:hypothetical protein B0H16DRAFT_1716047 [Mycena metata]
MCFWPHPTASNNYLLQGKLSGHSGGIVRLCATEDGRLLASAATDGTKVWDLSTMRELEAPKSAQIRGPSTVLVWVKHQDDSSEALLHGTRNGYLVCWKAGKERHGMVVFEEISYVRIRDPQEISGLAFDAPANRLALCHTGGVVQVYTVDINMSLHNIFSLELKNVAPVAVVFGQMQGNDRDVMVFGLHGGDIYTLRGNDGAVSDAAWNVGGFIGDVAIDVRQGVVCMDEPSSGVNLYRLGSRSLVKTFPVAPQKANKRLRQVAFADEGTHRRQWHRSKIVDQLRVHKNEWVQTVTTADSAGHSIIFATKSRDLGGSNNIFVWRKKRQQRVGRVGTVCMVVLIQLGVIMLLAAVLFVYQKLAVLPPPHLHHCSALYAGSAHLHCWALYADSAGPLRDVVCRQDASPRSALTDRAPFGRARYRPRGSIVFQRLRVWRLYSFCKQMSSHSYQTASRGSRSNQPYPNHFPPPQSPLLSPLRCLPHLWVSSACATPNGDGTCPAPAPVNDYHAMQILFTLFLLQTHLIGDWCLLVIPYAIVLLVFFPTIFVQMFGALVSLF